MRRIGWAGSVVALVGAGVLGATVAAGTPESFQRQAAQAAVTSTRPGPSLLRRPAPGFYAPSASVLAGARSVLADTELSAESVARASLLARPQPFAAQDRECQAGEPDRFFEFYFTRAIYSNYRSGRGSRGFGGRNFGGGSWSVDYPKADCQFISVVKRLAGLDMFYDSNAINLDDSRVRNFPFLYALEVGGMSLTEQEVVGLREYLAAGGFLVIDDFWGTQEWRNFEREITRVLPDRPIVELPLDHAIFSIFYTFERILQVPNQGNARAVAYGFPGAGTWESDGYTPHVLGMFDDKGRLMVIINWNTDLGDAWEWAEQPDYPLEFSTYAFEMGVNMILYSMTH